MATSLSSLSVLFLFFLCLTIVLNFGQLSTIYIGNLFSRSLLSLFTFVIASVQIELFDARIPRNITENLTIRMPNIREVILMRGIN